MMMERFDHTMHTEGWALLPGVVPQDLLESMRRDLDFAYAACRAVQKKNGVAEETEGTVHHLPALRQSFLDFLERNPAAPYIKRFFEDKPYVLGSMGGNFNFGDATNYAGAAHRDIRSYFKDRLMLNTLVTLDDVTPENGATWLMVGGHRIADKPSDEEFDARALQVPSPAGSILMWDSRLWHRAGVNRTNKPRRIVTPIYTLPLIKQGFDYPRALGDDRELSDVLRQVLGYRARVPASLEDWYRKPAERFYMGDQG